MSAVDINHSFIALARNSTGTAINLKTGSLIGNVKGDFFSNEAYSSGASDARGGAIYNWQSTMGNIDGNFIGNSTHSYARSSSDAAGGAIYNYWGNVGHITGDFVRNSALANRSIHAGSTVERFIIGGQWNL